MRGLHLWVHFAIVAKKPLVCQSKVGMVVVSPQPASVGLYGDGTQHVARGHYYLACPPPLKVHTAFP